MSLPAFTVGQAVSVAPSKQYRQLQGGYRVVGAMPLESGGFQYRVKSDLEKHERVINERHLSAE